jgi:hypothetical protein
MKEFVIHRDKPLGTVRQLGDRFVVERRAETPRKLPATRQLAAAEPRVLRGVVIAEIGTFKDSRGQFSAESLRSIVRAMRANDAKSSGTRVHFGHEQALGSYVGRVRNPRLSTTTRHDGQIVECVRGDLHLEATADKSPSFPNLASYVFEMGLSDSSALNMSLVLSVDEIPVRGQAPIWIARLVDGVDVVVTGAATSSLLGR